ncbi:MAG: hypothetical protein H6937_13525 [Burkholderiales bacterium]|nr:hypothetical protein [Rhodospirillales bacterium]MCP5246908.1 hypothetical protein [Burkholderiales bacterium]
MFDLIVSLRYIYLWVTAPYGWLVKAIIAPFRIFLSENYKKQRLSEGDYGTEKELYVSIFWQFMLAISCIAVFILVIYLSILFITMTLPTDGS